MTRIKICGVTQPDDAARVAAIGVEMIGLNFWPRSKRYLPPERAGGVAASARSAGSPELVGVFVNAALSDIVAVAAAVKLDAIQLHGDESREQVLAVAAATGRPVWKAVPARGEAEIAALDQWGAETILLDTPSTGRGGAGVIFDWTLAKRARVAFPRHRLVLAGGLEPANVAAAIAQVAPFAVDVATGVESAPGVKDLVKVTAFVTAVRGA